MGLRLAESARCRGGSRRCRDGKHFRTRTAPHHVSRRRQVRDAATATGINMAIVPPFPFLHLLSRGNRALDHSHAGRLDTDCLRTSSPRTHQMMEPRARSSRRYGFACLVCRRKKVRCGGEKPTCQNCVKADERCSYKPSDPGATRLSSELTSTQARVRELEQTLRRLSILGTEDRDKLLSEIVGGAAQHLGELESSPGGTSGIASSASLTGLTPDGASQKDGLEEPELMINEHGEVI